MASTSSLARYWEKRDFSQTREPSGRSASTPRASEAQAGFVIQRHEARRLHYDFRLELDGVLKSWAVPKGPSRDPAVKRLAVAVEDHPLDYADFEGDIPPGQYGAGHVSLWDAGTWQAKGDPRAGLAKGRLHFTLRGVHLQGEWILIRTGRDDAQWLLRKLDDGHAMADDDAEAHLPSATASKRRAVAQHAARIAHGDTAASPASDRRGTAARRTAMPAMIAPQLAMVVDRPPAEPGWVYELKYDGYRMMCRVDGGKVTFFSRTGKDWTARMRPLARDLAALALGRGWIDGEVVVFDDTGMSSFQALQNALDATSSGLRFVAFDLPWWEGEDLRARPLLERQERLRDLLEPLGEDAPITFTDRIDLTDHGDAGEVVAQACRLGLEGLIVKRADAPYESARAGTWLKLKCRPRQEFVVGGYTEPAGSRTGFGALLVGVREGDGLRYVGRIGTGFDARWLELLTGRLRATRREDSPFAGELPAHQRRFARGPNRTVHWVEPELVIEAEFAGWTSDGLLRQAAFVGLREDKPARDVGPEIIAQPTDAGTHTGQGAARRASKRSVGAAAAGGSVVSGVRISNATRRIFTNPDVSKIELARYYESVGAWLMPHLDGRRLAMLRCPQGVGAECFFQKHISQSLPDGLKRDGEHILAATVRGVIGLAQHGVIELHTWGSRLPRAERPDRITLDLDPGEGITWPTLVEATQLTGALLREVGLQPFVKTTGGKGMHVVAPIRRTLEWDAAKAFASGLARHLAGLMPDRFTANMSKAKRNGRIFIDYLRNGENATAIAAFSVRARHGAPVSIPIAWEDLDASRDLRGAVFNLRNVPELLRDWQDPWVGYEGAARTVTKDMQTRLTPAASSPQRRKAR